MQHSVGGLIRFSVFEVDIRSGELRKRGVRIPLQQQPFRILSRLVERPGEVVTREELHRELWPADTHVDFEQGINGAVKRLREALGDSAETPRFIETLPKRGYRFIAPINSTLSSTPPEPIQSDVALVSPSLQPRARKISGRMVVVALAILAVGAAVVLVNQGKREPARPVAQLPGHLTLALASDLPVFDPAISADGKMLCYAAEDGIRD